MLSTAGFCEQMSMKIKDILDLSYDLQAIKYRKAALK